MSPGDWNYNTSPLPFNALIATGTQIHNTSGTKRLKQRLGSQAALEFSKLHNDIRCPILTKMYIERKL